MTTYRCTVADKQGKMLEIIQQAASEETLLRELSSRSLFAMKIEEVTEKEGGVGRKGYSRKLILEFTDLLTVMMGSGVSLKDALELAQGILPKGEGVTLARTLVERIGKGDNLSSALESSTRGFPNIYHGLVRIGERIGTLATIFAQLSVYMKDEKKIRDKFVGAMIYPAIIMSVAVVGMLMIMFVLLPQMKDIFSGLGPALAARMQNLTATMNNLVTAVGVVVFLVVAFLVFIIQARKRGGPLARRIDALMLKVPGLGGITMNREILGFAFAMQTLTQAGISIEDAMKEAASAVKNREIQERLKGIRERILGGERLSVLFMNDSVFPPRVGRWIGIGEKVGHVETVFGQLKAFYETEVDKWTSRIMALVEPVIILLLGVGIIVFVVLFILPLYSVYGSVQ